MIKLILYIKIVIFLILTTKLINFFKFTLKYHESPYSLLNLLIIIIFD